MDPVQSTPGTGPQLVALGSGAPQPSATEIASREALARIEQTGTALPAGSAPAAPRVPAGDPDGRGGRFSADQIVEAGHNLPRADEQPAPAPGQQPPAPPAPGDGTQQPPAAPKPGEAPPAADPANPDGTPPADDERLVTFQNEAGEEIAVEIDDPELAAKLREVSELTLRGAEVERAMQTLDEERAALLEQRAVAQHDPVGFILDNLRNRPEQIEEVVLYLVSHPDVQARLGKRIAAVLSDPDELRVTKAEMSARRSETAATVSQVVQEERMVAENLREVRGAVASMLPAGLPADARAVVERDMLNDIANYADRRGLLTVPVTDLPTLLASRLAVLGIDPATAARQVMEASTSRRRVSRFRGTAQPAAPAARPAAPVAPAARTGRAFVEGQQRRTAVGSIPGAGAGSPGAPGALETPRNPDGSPMSVEQTVAWHRQRVAAGQRVIGV